MRALQADPRQALRHELLSQLVARLGGTCNLTVLDGTRVRYLDRVETHWPLRIQLEAGSMVPIHATASGKLFLAHMPAARRAAILDSVELTACTANTLTTPEALAQECARIVREGHSCDREEFMRGMIAVAVPVRDAKGQCRATLAVHAPEARMPLAQALEGLPHLKETAQRMAGLLFCGAGHPRKKAPTLPLLRKVRCPQGAAFCLGAARRQEKGPHSEALVVTGSPAYAATRWTARG